MVGKLGRLPNSFLGEVVMSWYAPCPMVAGRWCYFLPDGSYLRGDPLILGGERWELHNMALWTQEEVVIFIRRLGLKEYLPSGSRGEE